ncbi:hypothetical protein U8335_25375 [Roseiconus lacunae]|uniref:hypothetical protein n=1 Tax=Roseiconus lacunae TaxID=2605694 RepID=UPI0030938875|nr:hypothetical protein U8335_25375 [Stieleria sp. HD01]
MRQLIFIDRIGKQTTDLKDALLDRKTIAQTVIATIGLVFFLLPDLRASEPIDIVFWRADSGDESIEAVKISSAIAHPSDATVVRLMPSPAPDLSSNRQIRGASGRDVTLPNRWHQNRITSLMRGIATGPNRPFMEERDKTLRTLSPVIPKLREMQSIDASRLPSDVVAFLDRTQRLHVAADWNCDLQLTDDECYIVTNDWTLIHPKQTPIPIAPFESAPQEFNDQSFERIMLSPCSFTELPETVRAAAITPRDAIHLWFRLPDHPPQHRVRLSFGCDSKDDEIAHQAVKIWTFSNAGWRSPHPVALNTTLQATPRTDWIMVATVDKNEKVLDPQIPLFADIAGEKEAVSSDHTDRWLTDYDHDPMTAAIEQRIALGIAPEQLVEDSTTPTPDRGSIIEWRNHLVTIDHPRVRKRHLNKVVAATEQVMKRCIAALAEQQVDSGAMSIDGLIKMTIADPPPPLNARREQILYAWLADAAYRRVRAIGYRELPDVIKDQPIEDWDIQNTAYNNAYQTLCQLVPINDWRFVLTRVRFERRRGNAIKAYEILVRYGYQGPATPWYFKKERDLWSEAGDEALSRLGHARWFLKQAGVAVTQ